MNKTRESDAAPKRGLGFTNTVRKVSGGWVWFLQCHSETVAQGRGSTQRECLDSLRAEKLHRERPRP